MSFIEGIGDEVTACFVILIVIALATLVTFIGNGYSERLYNASPLRAQPLVIVQETQSQQAQQREVWTTESPDDNRNLHQPNDQLRTSRENTSSEEAATEIVNPESYSHRSAPDERWPFTDNEEDQNSPREANPECETPEEVCEEGSEQSTESTATGIRIRLKYLDDTERTVRSIPTVSIGEFKRNHFSEDLDNNKMIRLIFCGHLLRDNSTLESHRVIDNSVIHVQILQAQTDQNRTPVSQNTDLDLSNFLWPLLSIVLGVCWVFYFKYPEFFSLVSIGILLLFTSGFVFLYSQLRIR